MILARLGDNSATVAVIQTILNELDGTSQLVVDGVYGRATSSSVRKFQQTHGRTPTGTLDPSTWDIVRRLGRYSIVDIVDLAFNASIQNRGGRQGLLKDCITDFQNSYPTASQERIRHWAERYVALAVFEAQYNGGFFNRIRAQGGNPVAVRDPNAAFTTVMSGIRERSTSSRIVLVRFQGHGGPLNQGIAASAIMRVGLANSDASLYALERSQSPERAELLGNIRHFLEPWAAIEMHGCHVGGRRENGSYLPNQANISSFADFFMLPVTASPDAQFWKETAATRESYDYRLEGRVISTTPLGGNLQSWFQIVGQ